ncbi:unnamed protein product, partial [Polarella glacialis]
SGPDVLPAVHSQERISAYGSGKDAGFAGFFPSCGGHLPSRENSLAFLTQPTCCIPSSQASTSTHELVLIGQSPILGDYVKEFREEGPLGALGGEAFVDDRGLQRYALSLGANVNTRFEDCYRLDKQLGDGSFGNVYQAVPSSSSQALAPRRVAVKVFIVSRETLSKEVSRNENLSSDQKRRKCFLSEVAMLARLEHPHIVRMYGSFQSAETLNVVLEICRGGELYACLVRRIQEEDSHGRHGCIDERTGQLYFRQMLLAISYLHSQ